MAITYQLSFGNFTLPLVYDPGVQERYRLMYGANMAQSEGIVIWHQPDHGAPELVDIIDNNRTKYFTLGTFGEGGDPDDALDALNVLGRWVHGARQRAARHKLFRDNPRMNLIVRRDGVNNATVMPIIYGFVNDGDAHWGEFTHDNDIVYPLHLALTLAPMGESSTKYQVKNLIKNGDFSQIDGGASAQICLGWAKNLGTEGDGEFSYDETNFLTNGRAQRVACGSDQEGVRSISYSVTDADLAGYVWVYLVSGSMRVTLWNATAASSIQTKTLTSGDGNGISDKTETDQDGKTWYRIPVVGSVSGTANVQLRAYNWGGGAEFSVDNGYLDELGNGVPPFWASHHTVYNRGDPDTTNYDYINWLDVWGIPGDAPALVNWKMTSSASRRTLFAGRVTEGTYDPHQQFHQIDLGNLNGNTLTLWGAAKPVYTASTVSGDGVWDTNTGGNFNLVSRYTRNGTPVGLTSASKTWYFSGSFDYFDYTRKLFMTPRRAFMRASTDTAGTTIQLDWKMYDSSGDTTLWSSEAVGFDNLSQFDLLDMGYIQTIDILPSQVPNAQTVRHKFTITIVAAESSVTQLDTLWLPWCWGNDDFLIYRAGAPWGTSDGLWILGEEAKIVTERGGVNGQRFGTLYTLDPGPVVNRTTWFLGDENTTITESLDFLVEVIPRTYHLFGNL